MMKSILSFILICGLCAAFSETVCGQSKKTLKQYASAKNLLAEKKYEGARILFETVYQNPKNKDLRANALFFIAITQHKANNLREAQEAIERLVAEFPAFEQKDEALYLLAEIQFKNKAVENALATLDGLQSYIMQDDIKMMKGFYLQALDLPALRKLSEKRPKDTLIAQMIVDRIASKSTNEEEIEFMQGLIKDLKLEKPATMRFEKKIFTKPTYKIAVLLPFELERLKKRDTTTLSRVSVALYQGMRVAQQELDTLNGIKVKLYAYEIGKNDREKLNSLLSSKEFQDIDAFVGPLFDSLHRAVAEILPTQKSVLINPISLDNKLLLNPYIYLYESTFETQAQKTVEFLGKQSDNKNIVIFYDDSKKNKNLATLVKQRAEAMGMKVLAFEEVSISDLSPIKTILQKYNRYEVGSIFASSTSNLVAEELIKYLQSEKYEVPVIVPEAWLRFQNIDADIYEQLKVHILYPDFLNTEDDKNLPFKKAYANLAHQQVSNNNIYPFIGYEVVHHLAKLWQEAGTQTDFAKSLRKIKAYQGKTTEWLEYAGKQDNQFVPILRFTKGELELANKPQ